MRWGIELWDGFDDISSYMHKGIEFFEKYEEFWKKRCAIENTYAKSLRKLVESYEPKKKEPEEDKPSHIKCFAKMLNELKDIASQHELIAENVQERVTKKLIHVIKSLKEDRRKCIEDRDKFLSEHNTEDELLEKSKSKYEKAFKEVEKAKDSLLKVENDDSASKNDIKRQKSVVESKQNACSQCQADYGKQLCQANKVKSVFYGEKLPAVLDTMQRLETKRVDTFKQFASETVAIEIEVMPRIQQCLEEIRTSCDEISSESDTDLLVTLFKTGYTVPGDHVFEDLTEKYSNMMNTSKASLNNSNSNHSHHTTSGFLNSTNGVVNSIITLATPKLHNSTSRNQTLNNNQNPNGHIVGGPSLNSVASRQTKYRTINRIKGLLFTHPSSSMHAPGRNGSLSSNGNGDDHDLAIYDLPPQQLKKELNRKIDSIQTEMIKKEKEREGLIKLKDIYSTNEKFGDSQSALDALKSTEEKLISLGNQLKKYKNIIVEIESNGYYSSSPIGSQTNGEVNGTEYLTNNGTHTHKMSPQNNIYQSSVSEHSVNSNGTSLPGTPMSYHSNGGAASKSSTLGAYAISSVAQMNGCGTNHNVNSVDKSNGEVKIAPMASSDQNESFEDEEDDEDDDDDNAANNYEKPIHTSLKYSDQSSKSQIITQTQLTSSSHTIVSSTSSSNYKSSTAARSDTSPKYDRVDSTSIIYEQHEEGTHDVADQANDSLENEPAIGTALVIYTFSGMVQNAMSVHENESLDVLERDSGDGWTLVRRLHGEKGYVPTDYIRIVYY